MLYILSLDTISYVEIQLVSNDDTTLLWINAIYDTTIAL